MCCCVVLKLDVDVGADAEEVEGGRSHTRGKAPYVFVTWDNVQDSVLNLPVEKMDFYVPG